MKVKLTATAVWNVHVHDRANAEQMLKDQPTGIICDYLDDARLGDEEMEGLKATAELVES